MDYKSSNIAGTSWQRAVRVVVENPLGGTPSINFVEEKVISLGAAGTNTSLCSNVGCAFNPATTFPQLDATTGVATGVTYTHAQLYQMLNSLYMALAGARDAAKI